MRNIKLSILISVLMVLSQAVLFAAPVEQTEDSGSLIISGSVARRVSIEVTAQNNTGLDLMETVADQLVAVVTEKSNARSGYSVSLASANGSIFAEENNPDFLAYTLTYNGAAVNFNTGNEALVTDESSRLAGTGGVVKELKISYDGRAVNIHEGNYSDELTFTITAK